MCLRAVSSVRKKVGLIHFGRDADLGTVDDKCAVTHFNRAAETAVHGVVFEHVCEVIDVE